MIRCGFLAMLAGSLPAPTSAGSSNVAPNEVTLSRSELDENNFRRAIDLWLKDDYYGAVTLLEEIDVSTASRYARADRAAFLLAVAYLRLDDIDGFHSVASTFSNADSRYRQWIRYAQLIESTAGAPSNAEFPMAKLAGANILTASLLLELDRPHAALTLLETNKPDDSMATTHLYIQGLARIASGGNPEEDWVRLAKRTANSPLEADLIGGALIQLAANEIERGGDATELLERVPGNSRHTPRALHILAELAVERGDHTAAAETFKQLLDSHPAYESRRDVELSLGALSMDETNWRAALAHFESAESLWAREFKLLDRLEDERHTPEIWKQWEAQNDWREEIRLAPQAIYKRIDTLTDMSLDLRIDSPSASDDFGSELWLAREIAPASPDNTDVAARNQPSPSEWTMLGSAQMALRKSNGVLAQHDRATEDFRRELRQRVDYTRRGRDDVASVSRDIASALVRLELMLSRLDETAFQLAAARDIAIANIAVRTRDMVVDLREQLLFIQAMRHFHVDGPNQERDGAFPPGIPSPAELLVMEQSLANEITDYLELFAKHNPDVIARSFSEIWAPRVLGDSRNIRSAMQNELSRAQRVATALDSTSAWHANNPNLAAAMERRNVLVSHVDSLRADRNRLRIDIGKAVATRGRERLKLERESIDYHLADASYEVAVQVAIDPAFAADSTRIAPLRSHATARLDTFLARYPQSVARAESRFRLADLSLMEARDNFQAQMRSFLGNSPTADTFEDRSLAPFVDYGASVSLYESILAEDPTYPHIDAVLFNLGMILSDDGQPIADQHLSRLVREYPESPNCQEAWLRMGSDRFDRREFAASVSYFEEAAAGTDVAIKAIALYKLGWANFEEDYFGGSTDAFRRLMDLYESGNDVARSMDLRDEAEEYLVHSLSRSGGADAFRLYFDEIGERSYETHVLLSMAHLMTGFSLYEEAVECDELWLARYPKHPRALPVAERLVDNFRSWNKPGEAREAKLLYAKRFLAGSDWHEANHNPKLRARGQRFSQSAFKETAAHHHQQARKSDASADWRLALTNYEHYLAQWPDDKDSAQLHFLAGETAHRLDDFPRSLSHFEAATRTDSTMLARDASWQRVAVADAWYQAGSAQSANTSDSLATNLLRIGEEFVDRFGTDERVADIVWRQGNVAYIHEWYDGAATTLATFADRYPQDTRAVAAVRLSGDARYQLEQFDFAGAAYEKTSMLARANGQDSVVVALKETIPLCYYKHAEAVASSNSEKTAAHLFAQVAHRFPEFKHADLALYRAGLGYAERNSYADAAGVWNKVLSDHPESEYARDSAIQIAMVYEKSGDKKGAAEAYERFSGLYKDDPDAPEFLLKAAELLTNDGDLTGADNMRSIFLDRFPGEVDAAMEIRAQRATDALAGVTAGTTTLVSLLSSGTETPSELQTYLNMAKQHPDLATPAILAQVDFLIAEEAYATYSSMQLTQPLPASIKAKKVKLEEMLRLYDQCTTHGVTEYSRASGFQIGQVLIDFGDALNTSERPPDLTGDDLIAYNEVLEEQSWEFYDRGEDIWSELLRQSTGSEGDPGQWVERARTALWPRLSQRFLYRPETEYPLIAAAPPTNTDPK